MKKFIILVFLSLFSVSSFADSSGAILSGGGSGDVEGPAIATDECFARFDLTTGKLIQNSIICATDTGIVTGITQLNVDNIKIDGDTVSNISTGIILQSSGANRARIYGGNQNGTNFGDPGNATTTIDTFNGGRVGLGSSTKIFWNGNAASFGDAADGSQLGIDKARESGFRVSNSGFSAHGDASTVINVLRNSTSNNSQTELFLNGSSVRLVLSNDTSWIFDCKIVARRTDADNESAGYLLEGMIDRQTNAASTALVGTVTKTVYSEDSDWDVTAEADSTNGALVIKVTGETSKTIRWAASCRTVEVTG